MYHRSPERYSPGGKRTVDHERLEKADGGGAHRGDAAVLRALRPGGGGLCLQLGQRHQPGPSLQVDLYAEPGHGHGGVHPQPGRAPAHGLHDEDHDLHRGVREHPRLGEHGDHRAPERGDGTAGHRQLPGRGAGGGGTHRPHPAVSDDGALGQ